MWVMSCALFSPAIYHIHDVTIIICSNNDLPTTVGNFVHTKILMTKKT